MTFINKIIQRLDDTVDDVLSLPTRDAHEEADKQAVADKLIDVKTDLVQLDNEPLDEALAQMDLFDDLLEEE